MFKNIHEAVKAGNIESVAELIKQGACINELDCNKMTPIHWAVNVGAIEVLQFLLWHKADPLILTPNGWNPVHIAAIRGHEACIQVLVSRGINVSQKDNKGCTPSHLAAIHGNSFSLQNLLRAGADLCSVDNYGWSLLHAASFHGRLGCVQILVKWGLKFDDTDNMGNTPAHLAALEGHLPVLQYLISSCGNKEYILQCRNDNGETPKLLAQQFLKQEIIDYLEGLERSVSIPFEDDFVTQLAFPAHTAAHKGDLKQLRALIEGGIVKVNERDDQNSTPLHKASGQGNCEIVQWLVEYGANPNILNDSGETPIDIARRFGQLAVLYLLCPSIDELEIQNFKRSLANKDTESDDDSERIRDITITRKGRNDEEFLENLSEVLKDVDIPYGDLEGEPIQMSESQKKASRARAYRRMQKLENLYETARQDYRLLGGQPSEAEKLEIRKIRNAERRVEELEGELEYERIRRERNEAELDENRRDLAIMTTKLHEAFNNYPGGRLDMTSEQEYDFQARRLVKTSERKLRTNKEKWSTKKRSTSAVNQRPKWNMY